MIRSLARGLLLVGLLAACGGDANGPGNPFLNGTFEARINGADFDAVLATVVDLGGLVAVVAGNEAEDALSFSWEDAGPGTYTIGGGATTQSYYSVGAAEWSAGDGQGSGSLVITTRTATRMAGTFAFVLEPTPGSGATGTRTVTQGSFNLRL